MLLLDIGGKHLLKCTFFLHEIEKLILNYQFLFSLNDKCIISNNIIDKLFI